MAAAALGSLWGVTCNQWHDSYFLNCPRGVTILATDAWPEGTVIRTPIHAVICVLCRNLVSLESARTDDNGRTVHEACYLERLLARQAEVTVELKSRET